MRVNNTKQAVYTPLEGYIATKKEHGTTYVPCEHESLRVEEVDYGYADQARSDWVEDWHFAYVCNKCEAILEGAEIC